MSDRRRIRAAIAGLGFGQAAYIPVLQSIEDVELVGVASRRLEKAQAIAARHGIAVARDSVQSLLAEGLDLMCLALPPSVAAAAVEVSLGAGLAVVTEKPLGATVPELDGIIRIAHGPGRTIGLVNFSFAELRSFRALGDVIASGRLGALRRVAMRWRNESYAHRHQAWGWKTDRTLGGGILSSLGSHVFHLLESMCGPVVAMRAVLSAERTRPFAPAGAVPAADFASIDCRLKGGLHGSILLENAAQGVDEHVWEVDGEGGTLILERTGPGIMTNFVLRHRDSGGRETVLAVDDHSDTAGGRLLPLRTLIARAVDNLTGRPSRADVSGLLAGCRVQTLIAAAEAAAGTWIDCPP